MKKAEKLALLKESFNRWPCDHCRGLLASPDADMRCMKCGMGYCQRVEEIQRHGGTEALDEKGRCCGRKPLVYKRHDNADHPRGHFCIRCDRSFDLQTGKQIPNWAWKLNAEGVFERTRALLTAEL